LFVLFVKELLGWKSLGVIGGDGAGAKTLGPKRKNLVPERIKGGELDWAWGKGGKIRGTRRI